VELSQKEPLLGGPGGPDHVVRTSRIPHEAKPTATEAEEVVQAFQLGRPVPSHTASLRSQPAYRKAAGATTQEVEQQLHALPVERSKSRGGADVARAQLSGDGTHGAGVSGKQGYRSQSARVLQGGQGSRVGGRAPEQYADLEGQGNLGGRNLFDRQRNDGKVAGLTTGNLAASDPYFITDLDAGVKMGATHPSRLGELVFGRKSPAANRLHGNTELEDAPEYKGRLGIPSSKYGARDPIMVGDCPPGTESASATTWKSQVDEVLYGVDLDGSGDYAAMSKAIDDAPMYRGAAGVSSLKNANNDPDFRVEVNTRIQTTYAQPEMKEDGTPIREPIREKRVGYQPPELFSKAGVSGWLNTNRYKGAAPGKDELWRPHHKQGKWFYSG